MAGHGWPGHVWERCHAVVCMVGVARDWLSGRASMHVGGKAMWPRACNLLGVRVASLMGGRP